MNRDRSADNLRSELRDVEVFLYREARLLDEGRLEEWLELFTDDGTYWLPIDEADDPLRDPSLLYDNSDLRWRRIVRLMSTPAYAQRPPSETVHQVTNIEVVSADGEHVVVACTVAVHETRTGDTRQLGLGYQRVWPARVKYTLRRNAPSFLIQSKTAILLSRRMALPNLAILI